MYDLLPLPNVGKHFVVYHNMQYQEHPRCQNRENDQMAENLIFDSLNQLEMHFCDF